MPDSQRPQTEPRREVVCALFDESRRAAHLAVRLAERMDRPLALVTIAPSPVPSPPPPPIDALAPAAQVDTFVPPVAGAPQADLHPWLAQLVTPAHTRYETMHESPGTVLEALARSPRTELLVAGDQGGGPLRAGSVRGALRASGSPLILVPEHGTPPAPDHLRTVLCGLEDDEAVDAVVDCGAALAERLGGRLVLAHVRERPLVGAAPEIAVRADLGDLARETAERLFGRARSRVPKGLEPTEIVVVGDAAVGLSLAAERSEAGLVVVASPHHGPLGSWLLGSAAHDLLRTSGRPLVVTPRGDDLSAVA